MWALHLDVVPHVEQAGGGRAAGDGGDPAPAPALLQLPASAPITQSQLGRQPVRPNPVLHWITAI